MISVTTMVRAYQAHSGISPSIRVAVKLNELAKRLDRPCNPAVEITISNEAKALYAQMVAEETK